MQLACDIKLQVRMQGNFSKQEQTFWSGICLDEDEGVD